MRGGREVYCAHLTAPEVKRCFFLGGKREWTVFLSFCSSQRLAEPLSILPELGPNQSNQIRLRVLEEVQVGSLPASQLDEAVSLYLILSEVLLSDHFSSWISINEEHMCSRGPDPGPGSCSTAEGTVFCLGVTHSYSEEQLG